MTVNDLLSSEERKLLARHWPKWATWMSTRKGKWVCGTCSPGVHDWPCDTATTVLALIEARRETVETRLAIAVANAYTEEQRRRGDQYARHHATLRVRAGAAEAELGRLKATPEAVIVWCPQCGPEPRSDEDGCCQQCGATIGEVPDWISLRTRAEAAEAERDRLREAVEKLVRYAQHQGGCALRIGEDCTCDLDGAMDVAQDALAAARGECRCAGPVICETCLAAARGE